MKAENMKIEIISLHDLTPYENNTRKHGSADIEQIAQSIAKYGFNDPVGVWGEENLIVEGHGRVMAAKKIGMQEIPCIRLDHLDEEQRREYAIAHNAIAELSKWDAPALSAEIEELDFSGFAFDLPLQKNSGALELDKELRTNEEKRAVCHCPKCGFEFEI